MSEIAPGLPAGANATVHEAGANATVQGAGADASARHAARCLALGATACVVLMAAAAARRTIPVGTTIEGEDIPERWRVDVNGADAVELALLPGVGPSIAARIVESRRVEGAFGAVDELERVSGIGPATIERIRAWATVTRADPERP